MTCWRRCNVDFPQTVVLIQDLQYPKLPPNVQLGSLVNIGSRSCLDTLGRCEQIFLISELVCSYLFSWRSAPAVMGLSACHGHGMQMRLNAKGQLGIGERFVGILSLWESKKVYLQSRSFSDLQQLCQVCRREQLWGEADILPRGISLWALGLRWGLPDAPAQERQQVLNHQKLFHHTQLEGTLTNLILQVLSCERGLPRSDEVRPSAGESQVGLQGQQAVLGDVTLFHEHWTQNCATNFFITSTWTNWLWKIWFRHYFVGFQG